MSKRTREFLIRVGALVVLLGVLLPNVTYVGHWSKGEHDEAIHDEAQAIVHAQHCHLGPSKCSGQQDFTGTWWIGREPPSVFAAFREEALPAAVVLAAPEPPLTRLLEPPRPV
mgnify:FL=1